MLRGATAGFVGWAAEIAIQAPVKVRTTTPEALIKCLNKTSPGADLVHCTLASRSRACALPARVPIERFWTACSAGLAGKSGLSAAAGAAGAGSLFRSRFGASGAAQLAADEKGLGIVTTASSADHPTRRDFLFVATGAVAAVGAAATVWPLVSQMNPDASTIAAGAPIEVDLAPIAEGQDIKVFWRGKPIYISHRTKKQIDEARAVPVASLPDPASDQSRVKDGHDQWLVVIGICTHLGCIPIAHEGNYDGFFCPCHGSQYDSSGRIRQGPAPANLPVPPYQFVSDTKIQIG
jgi:ubiquinol-cytochrome c reductase iron-sulfur subunit